MPWNTPRGLRCSALVLVVASYFCYQALGTDLLPAMDEGGFILDYCMPPGSSLEETNRMVAHIEQMLRAGTGSGKHLAAHRTAAWVWPRSPKPTAATSPSS